MTPDAMAALTEARTHDPFALLGPHATSEGIVVRTLLPFAEKVALKTASRRIEMTGIERSGLFECVIPESENYRLLVDANGEQFEIDDPYRFPSTLSDEDIYLFGEGTHEQITHFLGAHLIEIDGTQGVRFAVWAPNARRVSVIGDFNGWDARQHMMRVHPGCGIWEIFIPGIVAGAHYKYSILSQTMETLEKADPCATLAERPPATASVVAAEQTYRWQSVEWAKHRASANDHKSPISIYEVHAGSWRRDADGNYLTYRALADELVPYVTRLGFTHVQFMPLSEYPFDGSWGYQPTGMFAPTRRFGEPDDFRYLVDRCHVAGVGVLLDWVPAHFPNDPHGLARFDGTALYEHADPQRGFHPDWNTHIYNYGRREVASFLLSSGMQWLEQYQVDGLRVDAVASMLYRDYSRQAGQWQPNEYGGRENLEALAFLREFNKHLYGRFPSGATIAEESTAWPGVSRPTDTGGLGFGYKWNMGWMNDTLSYIARDPIHRSHHHDQLTFGLIYAFDENFVLPLSHDEVVHGKRSLLGRMPGDRWQQFANLRAYYGFMWAHPGKKLMFMGGEFAQQQEWNHDRGLDWHLLAHADHRGVQQLVTDLNTRYRQESALHELDCYGTGFQWLQADRAAESILAFARTDDNGDEVVVCCNFTPVVRTDYRLGVPHAGRYQEILNTDSESYGGSNVGNFGSVDTHATPADGFAQSLSITVPPLATVWFKRT